VHRRSASRSGGNSNEDQTYQILTMDEHAGA